MSEEDPIMRRVLAWKEQGIRQKANARPEAWNVPLLITELSDLPVCDLLRDLKADFDVSELDEFFRLVLDRDPSQGVDVSNTADFLREEPFPRHLVSLVYLMIMDCSDHDFVPLREAVWRNILERRHIFWPELLVEIFGRLEPAAVTCERAMQLAMSEDEHARFIGENILYSIPVSREERRRILAGVIRGEDDPGARRRYNQIRRKYC